MDSEFHNVIVQSKSQSEQFKYKYGQALKEYQHDMQTGIENTMSTLVDYCKIITNDNKFVQEVMNYSKDYVLWLQWTLLDLPLYAVALNTPHKKFAKLVSAVALIYQSIRILDDVLDNHLDYKGMKPTLLGNLSERFHEESKLLGKNSSILISLLLSIEGIRLLSIESSNANLLNMLDEYRKTVLGALLEYSPNSNNSLEFFDNLIKLKNVSFSRILLSSLGFSNMSSFTLWVESLYYLSQQFNDFQDLEKDVLIGQPNFIHKLIEEGSNIQAHNSLTRTQKHSISEFFLDRLINLRHKLEELNYLEQQVAYCKIYDLYKYGVTIGIFSEINEDKMNL
jgi:hypothetical protein